jgi:hypothetical protein
MIMVAVGDLVHCAGQVGSLWFGTIRVDSQRFVSRFNCSVFPTTLRGRLEFSLKVRGREEVVAGQDQGVPLNTYD